MIPSTLQYISFWSVAQKLKKNYFYGRFSLKSIYGGFEFPPPTKNILSEYEKIYISEQSTKSKLKNELLHNFIALLATEINGSEAVFLGRIWCKNGLFCKILDM